MEFTDHVKDLLNIIGVILAITGTAILAALRKKANDKISSNIKLVFPTKKKPFRKYLSERVNKELDALVIRTRCAAQADRCYVYIHHHYNISMTHEDVENGLKGLMPNRQYIGLPENGNSIAFMRDIKSCKFRGIEEVNVIREHREEEDTEANNIGTREVVYLNKDNMRDDTIPSMLMRESSTQHVLLSPIISKIGIIPYRHPRYFVIGVIGLDYIHRNIDPKKLFFTYAPILCEAQQQAQTFINVELMHTNLKDRLR